MRLIRSRGPQVGTRAAILDDRASLARESTEPVSDQPDRMGKLGQDDPDGIEAGVGRRPASLRGVVPAGPPVQEQIAGQQDEADPPGRPGQAEGEQWEQQMPQKIVLRVWRTK